MTLHEAIRDVLRRMSGCADPVCGACRHNREVIVDLINAARIDLSSVTQEDIKKL